MSGTSYLWCFAINPLTPTTVLAGGSCDHCPTIYRSTDRGAQWTGVYTSPGANGGDIHALAFDSNDPSLVYAVEQNWDTPDYGRILRSTDSGLSWTAVYTEDGLELNTVAAGSALAGGRDANGAGAIYHSSDGTTNWTRVHTISTGINSIVVHPVTPTIVLALGKHVYKSTDGGLIWTQITSRRVYGPKLAFNPLDANIVYSVGHSDPKISTDGGENWDLFRAGMPSGGWIGGIAVDRALGIQTLYIGYAGVWSYSQPSPLDVVYVTPGGAPTTTTDGILVFEAPPELTSTLTFTYTRMMSPSHSTGEMALAGTYFNLSACDDAGDPVHTFSPPLTLTVHYDESGLSPSTSEEDLLLYRWDTAAGEWQALTVLERDTDANTITVALDHLTEFALLGQPERYIYLPTIMKNY
jgi:hypothetical protein